MFTEDEAFLALALPPQVTPLPAPEIRSSRGNEALIISDFGLRTSNFRMSLLTSAAPRRISSGPLAVEQLKRAVEVVLLDGLLREVHVRGVGLLPGVQFAFLGPLPFMIDAIDGDGRSD